MALTNQQQRFIDLYVIPGSDGALNGTQAYRSAYPNCRSNAAARAAAARLLANVSVRAEVDRRLKELAAKTQLTAEEAWSESRCIAKSYIGDVIDFSGIHPKLKPANEIPESALRAIKSAKVKRYMEGSDDDAREVEIIEFTFWDKPGQLNTTLKALGELKDTVEHKGRIGVEIVGIEVITQSRSAESENEPNGPASAAK